MVVVNATANSGITHTEQKSSTPHKLSPVRIAKPAKPPTTESPFPPSQSQPVDGEKKDNVTSDNEDPLRGVFSDDDDLGLPDTDSPLD